jgi:hypothetical protein
LSLSTALATASRAFTLARIGLATRRARSGDTEVRRRAQAEVSRLLGTARGITLKVGQIAAQQAGAAGSVQLAVAPLPLSRLLPTLERELGFPLAVVFAEIAEPGLPASLGQVHRATLTPAYGGGEVAVKIRYPGIERAVAAELSLLERLPSAGPIAAWSMDLNGYRRVVREGLAAELDYRGEADRQRRFGADVSVPGLVVARVVDDLVRPAVLVQSWEPGEPFAAAASWPLRDRLELGQTLLRLVFRGLFVAGSSHADLNPGNLAARRASTTTSGRAELVLYDYGAMLNLDETRRRALLDAVVATRTGQPERLFDALGRLGFDPRRLELLRPELLSLFGILLAPFLADRPFELADWQPSARSRALLGEGRWLLRAAAPPELLPLMRLLAGLAANLATLGVALPWWPVLLDVVGAPALVTTPVDAAGSPAIGDEVRLCVEIRHADEVIFATALPARAALDLAAWLPAAVRERLAAAGVDLAAVETRCKRAGLVAGELFSGQRGERRFCVWLGVDAPQARLGVTELADHKPVTAAGGGVA